MKRAQRISCIGLLAIFLTLHLNMAKADDMGHFQVHNEQEGNLKIHATKEIAQVIVILSLIVFNIYVKCFLCKWYL